MHAYSLIAPAKINLHLEIIGDRADGYHELVMLLQSINLPDRIDIKSHKSREITLRCDRPQMPPPEQNLAYKAAQLMCEQFPKAFADRGGVDIILDKQIPIAAGLAGGSADAAAVLTGINMLWELGLTQPELQNLAALLGSDIPFCLAGGTAIATGRGEQLDPIDSPDNLWVVIAKYRSLAVSTAWAYNAYRQQFGETYASDLEDLQARAAHIHSGPLVKAIIKRDGAQIGRLLYNDLEKVVLPQYPQVAHLRSLFEEQEILGTMMSGSGPSVFALCKTQAEAESAKQAVENAIADPDLGLWIAQLLSHGIQVAER